MEMITSLLEGDFYRRFKKHKAAHLGLIIIIIVVLMTLLTDFISPYDPLDIDLDKRFIGPCNQHPMGTDNYGRDVMSRLLYGTRISLILGIGAVVIATFIGIMLGLLSGYLGGFVDTVIMRIMDLLYAFPGILLAMVIVGVLGLGLLNVMVAVAAWNIPVYARVVRAQILSIKEKEYVEAARSLGVEDIKIILHHILPNIMASIIILATLQLPSSIIGASSLSFLGLGVQAPTPEWGAMISDGQSYLMTAWWISTFPGLAIMFTVLGFNLFGDGLRDASDPMLKR